MFSGTLTPSFLGRISLFRDLDDETLSMLAEKLPVKHADPGDLVIREKEPAREMFVVLSGELEVVRGTDKGSEVRIAMLGPTDWFGEIAVLEEGSVRGASVRSLAHSVLLRVRGQDLEEWVLARDPKAYGLLMKNIARELNRRLRVADGVITQIMGRMNDYIWQIRAQQGA
jgi:CRP/FNR family cyclic AMP-dependent transcriptional regulator